MGWLAFPVARPGFVLALAAAALLLLVLWRAGAARLRAMPRRRRLVRAAVSVPLLLAVLAGTGSVADAVNVHFGYLPRLGDVVGLAVGGGGAWPMVSATDLADPQTAALRPDGAVLPLRLPDRGSGFGPSEALAYLPPQYFAQPFARFPVTYLLHGSPGVPADWLRGGDAVAAGLAQARAGRPVIIVMPAVSHGWLDDPECVDGSHERAESHFVDDVVPGVDSALRTVADREHRVLAGMSAGGYCALNLGLKHRDLVATIIDMSGLDRPTHRGGVSALYGPGEQARVKAAADSPGLYAPDLPAGPPVRVWLDDGLSDHETRPGMERLATELRVAADRGAGVSVELHLRPGAHTFHVWAPALRDSLDWATRGLPS